MHTPNEQDKSDGNIRQGRNKTSQGMNRNTPLRYAHTDPHGSGAEARGSDDAERVRMPSLALHRRVRVLLRTVRPALRPADVL